MKTKGWQERSAWLGCAALVMAGCAQGGARSTETSPAPASGFQMLPPGASWMPNPAIPAGGTIAIVAGSISANAPYAFRVRFPPGYRVMPHTHPDARIYTVLAGTWTIGLGEKFDSTALVSVRPGGTYVLAAGAPHFHYANAGEAIAQVNGNGPTATVYLDPADDPRKR